MAIFTEESCHNSKLCSKTANYAERDEKEKYITEFWIKYRNIVRKFWLSFLKYDLGLVNPVIFITIQTNNFLKSLPSYADYAY